MHYNVDPLAKIQDIIARAPKMKESELDFHYQFLDLFGSLRDKHTEYFMPGPYGCVGLFQAVRLDVVGWGANEAIVAVSGADIPDVNNMSPASKNIVPGDQLLAVNGVPIKTYLATHKTNLYGANEFGSLRTALLRIHVVDGRIHRKPDSANNVYLFKSQTTGNNYTVTLPWIAEVDDTCWKESVAPGTKSLFKRSQGGKKPKLKIMANSNSTTAQTGPPTNSGFKATADSSIFWTIHRPSTKNLGIIFIPSFQPGTSATGAINVIRSLLLNELKDTKAVVFNVEANSGGDLVMADSIPQFFGSNIKTARFRALANSINKDLLLNNNFFPIDDFSLAYQSAGKSSGYATLTKTTPDETANTFGQVYSKPVGVFTDAVCFSACELFAASMKDNLGAIIFGADGTSGGGGAGTVPYNAVLNPSRNDYFPQLPYFVENSLSSQDVMFGWLQIVRTNGQLIDDIGVRSDYVFRPSISDLIPYNGASQYDRVADKLWEQGQQNGKNVLYLQALPQKVADVPLGTGIPVVFSLTVRGYKSVKLLENNKQISSKTFTNSSMIKYDLIHNQTSTKTRIARYNIQASDFNGKNAFSTWRDIRFVPKKSNYLPIATNARINMLNSVNQKYFARYDANANKGWVQTAGQLKIGNGAEYANNLDTSVSYFVDCKATSIRVNIVASFATDEGYDYFSAGYVHNGTMVYFQEAGTGVGNLSKNVKISNAQLVTEFFFKFTSDSEYSGPGVNVTSFAITAE